MQFLKIFELFFFFLLYYNFFWFPKRGDTICHQDSVSPSTFFSQNTYKRILKGFYSYTFFAVDPVSTKIFQTNYFHPFLMYFEFKKMFTKKKINSFWNILYTIKITFLCHWRKASLILSKIKNTISFKLKFFP